MKFETRDGVQYIILDDNDKICVTRSKSGYYKQIRIDNNNKGLEISGDSSIISSIHGTGMMDKIYIPPVISSERIIEACDKWIDIFKQVHDAFKKLVLTEEYRDQDIVMHLECPTYSSLGDSNNKGKCITLDLERMGTVIQEGVDISIRDVNDDVYAYLFASVLDYYVSQNFVNTKINMMDYNGMLYSNKKREGISVPMLANLCNFNGDQVYWKIIDNILCNHNIGKTSEQLINNLKNKIFNQQIDDFDSLIDYSSNQCQYVLKKQQ